MPAESPYSPIGDLVAAARVTVGGAFADTKVLGFSGVVLAANVYTLTLTEPIDPTTASVKVSNASATAVKMHFEHTSDTTIEVVGLAGANVLTDNSFHIAVFRKAVR